MDCAGLVRIGLVCIAPVRRLRQGEALQSIGEEPSVWTHVADWHEEVGESGVWTVVLHRLSAVGRSGVGRGVQAGEPVGPGRGFADSGLRGRGRRGQEDHGREDDHGDDGEDAAEGGGEPTGTAFVHGTLWVWGARGF